MSQAPQTIDLRINVRLKRLLPVPQDEELHELSEFPSARITDVSTFGNCDTIPYVPWEFGCPTNFICKLNYSPLSPDRMAELNGEHVGNGWIQVGGFSKSIPRDDPFLRFVPMKDLETADFWCRIRPLSESAHAYYRWIPWHKSSPFEYRSAPRPVWCAIVDQRSTLVTADIYNATFRGSDFAFNNLQQVFYVGNLLRQHMLDRFHFPPQQGIYTLFNSIVSTMDGNFDEGYRAELRYNRVFDTTQGAVTT